MDADREPEAKLTVAGSKNKPGPAGMTDSESFEGSDKIIWKVTRSPTLKDARLGGKEILPN
jgi:hypothetical protein